MSQDINQVIEIGRLTRDGKIAYVGQTAKSEISIAVNRSVKRNDQWTEEVSYFDVVIWGKTAENLRNFLLKGKQIAVKGYLKQDRWEKDGQTRSRVYIVAENVQLLGSSEKNGSNGAKNTAGSPKGEFKQRSNTPPMYQDDYPGNGESIDDFSDEIPF